MQKLFNLFANAMAAFMDFGVGCLIATLTPLLWTHQLSWWDPILAGAFWSLLPDYDIIFQVIWSSLTGQKLVHNHHESLMHWPYIMVPLAMICVLMYGLLFGGEWRYWFVTGILCLIAHYIHDAVMMKGDGLEWIVRREPRYWSDRGLKEPGDPDHAHWIRENWLRPSRLSAIEVTIGSVAVGIATGIMTGLSFGLAEGSTWGFIVWFVFSAGAAAFWHTSELHKYYY